MVDAPRTREPELPALETCDDAVLATGADVDACSVEDVDLTGRDLRRLQLADSRVARAVLSDVDLGRARLFDTVLSECTGASLTAGESAWRGVALHRCRLGALGLHGSRLTMVTATGGKFDFVNLRAARLRDVLLQDCTIGELDLGGARLERVALPGCTVDRLQLHDTTLADVDLRETGIGEVHGIEHLRGATLRPGQLVQLAPAMATHLGIEVEP